MIPQIFSVLLFILFATLSWRDFKLALILMIGLLPIYLIRFSVASVPTTALELLIVTVSVIWFAKNRKKISAGPHLFVNPWVKAGLLLLTAASLAVTIAPDKIGALGIWKAYYIEPFILFIILKNTFNNSDWRKALKALAFSGIFVSCFAILQFIFNFGIPAPWDIERRVTSVFDYPNAVGLFLAPIVGLSFVMLLSAIKQKEKTELRSEILIWLPTVILGMVTIFLAKTEAALVAIPAGLMLTFLFSTTSKLQKIQVLSVSILATVVLIFTVSTVREKLFLQDYSGQVRLSQWQETAELLKHSPVLGVGLNSYQTALQPFHDGTIYEIFEYPHNIILNIWVELGLFGLVSFFWFLYLAIKTISLNKKTNSAEVQIIKYATFTALTIMAVHGLVDVPYFKNDLAVMTIVFLAALSLSAESNLD